MPGNFPNAHSALPFVLADCAIECDINDISDGGIWLRPFPAPGTAVGVKGVPLVTGGGGGAGTGLYRNSLPATWRSTTSPARPSTT